MGLLDTVLRKKESKEHNLGVCIPETYQKKLGKELQQKVFAGDPPVFKVTGTYEIPPTAIIGIILRDSFLLKLGPFIQIMTRLMMKRPDLAVPLYNPSGEVVWPIKI